MPVTFNEPVEIENSEGNTTIRLEPQGANIRCGGGSGGGGDGDLLLFPRNADITQTSQATIHLDSQGGNIRCGGGTGSGGDGDLLLFPAETNIASTSQSAIHLDAGGVTPTIRIGGNGRDGDLRLRSSTGQDRVVLNGGDGIFLRDDSGQGTISLFPNSGLIQAITVETQNGDCAEEFGIAEAESAEPGTVMVLDDDGLVRPSENSYDSRVVGVVSGAGNYQPALVLDRKPLEKNRGKIALMGKVYCKATAVPAPVKVGDLLTSSELKGHAMKAIDSERVFGAVIGKALAPLEGGQGLIPILIALQ